MISALLAVALAAPPAPAPVKVLFAGDVTLGFHYEEYVSGTTDAGAPRSSAWGFEKVGARTRSADLFVVNLECPFTESNERLPKNFNFRASPKLADALVAGGVDVVSLANNHQMDFGATGLADTIATLDAQKIVHFGAGLDLARARAPALVEKNGVRFAFLGYFFLGDRNIEPKEVIATDHTPGVAGHHDDLKTVRAWVEADVKAARAKADVVIPFFHWGREGHGEPEPYQVELAHAAIDAGAAAVIGSHPHVLQGMEQYQGRPILYSLGNFVFGGNWNPTDKRTALVELTFDKKGYQSALVLPAFSDDYPKSPVQPYLAEGDEAAAGLAHLRELSQGFKQPLPALDDKR